MLPKGESRIFSGAETEGPKAETGGGVVREGQQPSLHQLGGLGERC